MEIVKHFRYKDGKEYVFFEGKGYEVKRELEWSEQIELLDWYQTCRIDYFIDRLKEYKNILSDEELDKLFDTLYESGKSNEESEKIKSLQRMFNISETEAKKWLEDLKRENVMKHARLRGEL